MKFDEIFRAFKNLKISFLLEPFLDIIDDLRKLTSTRDVIRSIIHLTVTSSFLIFGGLFPHLVYPQAGAFVANIFTNQFSLPNWLGDYFISTLAFMWAFATPASFVTREILRGVTNCIYGDPDYYLTRNRAVKAAREMHKQFQNSDNLKDIEFEDVLGFIVTLHDWIVDKLALNSDAKDLSSELLIPARESLLRGDLNPKLVKVIKYMLNEHNIANDAMDALYRKYYLKENNITELHNITTNGANLTTCGTITAGSNNSTNTSTPVGGLNRGNNMTNKPDAIEHNIESNKRLADIIKNNLKQVGENQLKISSNIKQELAKSVNSLQEQIAALFNTEESKLSSEEINKKVTELISMEQEKLFSYLEQEEYRTSEFNDVVINMEDLLKQQEDELQKEQELQKENKLQQEKQVNIHGGIERIETMPQFNGNINREVTIDLGNIKDQNNDSSTELRAKKISKDDPNQLSFLGSIKSCKGWGVVKKRIK